MCQFTQNKILQQQSSILDFATDFVISIDRALREDDLNGWILVLLTHKVICQDGIYCLLTRRATYSLCSEKFSRVYKSNFVFQDVTNLNFIH